MIFILSVINTVLFARFIVTFVLTV